MALYVYKCDHCGILDEVVMSIKDSRIVECSVCRRPMSRQISASTFVLKGSGWAKDGYTKR